MMKPLLRHLRQILVVASMVLALAALLLSGCGSSSPYAVDWLNYSHLFNTPTARPWITILCKFSDVSDEPSGLADEAKWFLTTQGSGTGNMADYWSDVSYGAMTIAGSQVHGWYTAPYAFAKLSQFGKKYGNSARYEKVQQCADQVPSSDVDFSKFYGVIVILNKVNDGGACGTSSVVERGHHLACVLFDPASMYTAFAAQEMGHGYGLWHSSDETGAQYHDPFDVMSTCNANMFKDTNYVPTVAPSDHSCLGASGWDGPGLTVPNLLALGWIPDNHLARYTIGGPAETVTLAALSHPDASGTLALLVDDHDPFELYTVEFRTPDGWDKGFGRAAVYIHEYKPGLPYATVYSFLQKDNTVGGTGQLFAGTSWVGQSWNPAGTPWRVDVLSIGPTTATIRIQAPSLVSTAPIVQIQAPANLSHVTAGVPFQLVAKATTFDGHPLPAAAVVWTADGAQIGTGATTTASLGIGGSPYTITVTGTDQGQSASDSITLYVDPPATPVPTTPPGVPTPTPIPPTAVILSPTAGQSYSIQQYLPFQIVLSSTASAGVTKYAWSDSLHLFTDSKPNDTVTVSQQQVGCQTQTDTIQLTVTDSHGDTGTAAPVTITLRPECIQ